jgi:hypothetical protein
MPNVSEDIGGLKSSKISHGSIEEDFSPPVYGWSTCSLIDYTNQSKIMNNIWFSHVLTMMLGLRHVSARVTPWW